MSQHIIEGFGGLCAPQRCSTCPGEHDTYCAGLVCITVHKYMYVRMLGCMSTTLYVHVTHTQHTHTVYVCMYVSVCQSVLSCVCACMYPCGFSVESWRVARVSIGILHQIVHGFTPTPIKNQYVIQGMGVRCSVAEEATCVVQVVSPVMRASPSTCTVLTIYTSHGEITVTLV